MGRSRGRKKRAGGADAGEAERAIAKGSDVVSKHNRAATDDAPPPSLELGGAVFAVVMSVYFPTLFLGVPGGDSGELVAEACGLGVPHPPGYPLYTLMGHAFITAVPLGTPAWRLNLMCSIFGAFAAALIALAVETHLRGAVMLHDARLAGGAAAGLLYAFSPLVWQYSVGSEVFALNNFFAALVVYLALQFARACRRGSADPVLGGASAVQVAYLG